MKQQPLKIVDWISNRAEKREIQRQVIEHNNRVIETGRFELDRIRREDRSQLKNAVHVVLIVFGAVLVVASMGLLNYR